MKTTNLRGVGGGGVLTVHVKQRVACATLEDFKSYIYTYMISTIYRSLKDFRHITYNILSPCKPASCMMLGVSP